MIGSVGDEENSKNETMDEKGFTGNKYKNLKKRKKVRIKQIKKVRVKQIKKVVKIKVNKTRQNLVK